VFFRFFCGSFHGFVLFLFSSKFLKYLEIINLSIVLEKFFQINLTPKSLRGKNKEVKKG
jgi:hypothetical protein